MTQQTQDNHGAISPSLEAKLRQFAGALTPEEVAQVRAVQTHDVTGMMSLPLWDKAQQVADTLTPEEEAEMCRLLRRARRRQP